MRLETMQLFGAAMGVMHIFSSNILLPVTPS